MLVTLRAPHSFIKPNQSVKAVASLCRGYR